MPTAFLCSVPGAPAELISKAITTMNTREARLILNALPNVGPVTLRRLLDGLGCSPEALFSMPRARLMGVKGVGPLIAETLLTAGATFDLAREERLLAARGIRFLTPEEPGFPSALLTMYDPPIGLYASGRYEVGERCVAIVGTRKPTAYGRGLARELATELARAGWCVVSGLARGIDTEAHLGALEAGGPTVAVLGNGADIIYPPENAELYRRVVAEGVVLSEFPLGRKADKRTFPMRNRIVAGMCRAVVLVESDEAGGGMITARFAADMGKVVCAYPGRVDQPTSRGCHALIREGATLVTSFAEVLEELGEAPVQTELRLGEDESPEPGGATRSREESTVLAALGGGVRADVDALCATTGLGAGDVAAALLLLELSGLVSRSLDGLYERVGRGPGRA